MAWNITEADAYIQANTLDNEDYLDADEQRKQALLNVADRTIRSKFDVSELEEATINEAAYEFAPVLAAMYNDTNKLAQQGVSSFSLRGISFTFKDWAKNGVSQFIPESVYDKLDVPKRQIRRTLL